jgi:hypothetical protein
VSCFRNAQSRFNCFKVAHFADQHDVRILAQGSAESFRKSVSVCVDLALINNAVLVVMKKLDWVLNRQDVFMTIAIDLVHHRSKRC